MYAFLNYYSSPISKFHFKTSISYYWKVYTILIKCPIYPMRMQAMELFLSSIRSDETRQTYSIYFKKYQEFVGVEDIFCQNNPRLIEAKIIEFLTKMKSRGKGYSTIHNYAAAIMAFYENKCCQPLSLVLCQGPES